MPTTRARAGTRKPRSTRTTREDALCLTIAGLRRKVATFRAGVRARDEILFAAAHELRTPLTSVHGFARLLLTQLDSGTVVEPHRLREAVEAIEQQSHRLCRLVEGLLDASLAESGRMVLEPRPTDLGRLVEAVASLARTLRPQRTVVVEVPSPVYANVDPIRLEQVLINLVDNALKYSSAGARVTLSAESRGGTAVLVVADEGPGVPSNHRARIFDRFYRARPDEGPGGFGLGLHLCRQIVELHGGHLNADFPTTGGTRMVVRLPPAPSRVRKTRGARSRG